MCTFITATLPVTVNLALVRSVVTGHGLAFAPLRNERVQPQLGAGVAYFRATAAYCDCDTVLGRLRRYDRHRDSTPKVAALRRKGWSEAKVQRWLAEQGRTREKDSRAAVAQAEQQRPSAEEWLAFLRDMVAAGGAPVGLLMHFYNHGLETEDFSVLRRAPVAVATLEPAALLQLEDDVLYEFA